MIAVDSLSNRQLSNKYPTSYFLSAFFARMAREFAACLEKSTVERLRRLSSDALTKRSAIAPRNVGIAFT